LISIVGTLIAAYLLGSIPFGLLIVKAIGGGDIRQKGSGNIGAANVARSTGKLAGVCTLILDAAKGYAAVWLAGHFLKGTMRWMIAAAVAAVVGHVFSVWLRFRGGKGVATSLGVFLPIAPIAAIAASVVWILIVLFWGYSSLGSIIAAALLPLLVHFLYAPGHAPPLAVTLGTVFIALLVLVKHRSNMERLMRGEENRLKFR
jgi:acyl phosphate:glycerol-3-phosphate acyltransferase